MPVVSQAEGKFPGWRDPEESTPWEVYVHDQGSENNAQFLSKDRVTSTEGEGNSLGRGE